MPWRPLRRIVFGLAIHPFVPTHPDDLPLQVGDEIYIIEQGGRRGEWFRGYLVAPPSLLAGLSQNDVPTRIGDDGKPRRQSLPPLEARVFSGIFPACCVQLKEAWGGSDSYDSAGHGLDADSDNWDVRELTRWPGRERIPIPAKGEPRPPAPVPLLKIGDETTGPLPSAPSARGGAAGSGSTSYPATIDEVAACIREWHSTRLHRLVLSREYGEVEKLSGRIVRMDGVRRQLLRGLLTQKERDRLGQGIIREIWRGGGVVRIGFEEPGAEVAMLREMSAWERQVDSNNAATAKHLKHSSMTSSAGPLATIASLAASSKLDEAAWAELTKPVGETPTDDSGDFSDEHTPRHLLMDASASIGEFPVGADGEIEIPPVTMLISLAVAGGANSGEGDLTSRNLVQITESHALDLSARDSHGAVPEATLRTLFSGLTMTDLGEDQAIAQRASGSHTPASRSVSAIAPQARKGVYLVVKVLASEAIKGVDGREGTSNAPAPSANSAATTSQLPPGLMPSVIGSIKGGRRSFMWGRRHGNSGSASGPSNSSAPNSTAVSRPGTEESPPPASHPTNGNGAAPRRDKTIRRLIGGGTFYLSPSALLSSADKHFTMPLFQSWSSFQEDGVEQSGWDIMLPKVVPTRTGKYKRLATIPELKLTVRRFVHSDPQRLIREKPTVFYRVGLSKRVGSSPAPFLSPLFGDSAKVSMVKSSAPDSRSHSVSRSSTPSSDLFLTIRGIIFSKSAVLAHPKTGTSPPPACTFNGRNVQLTLEVRRSSGTRIENCIFPSANSAGTTAWRTMAIGSSESWEVMIRVSVSPADMRGGHIVMSVADAPGFPFALGWLPLWEDGAAVRNGKHELVLYAYDEHTSSMIQGRGAYLGLPWDRARAGKQILPPPVQPSIEFIALEVESLVGPGSGEIVSEPGVQAVLDVENVADRLTRRDVLQLLHHFSFAPEQAIVSALGGILDRLVWLANRDFSEQPPADGSAPLTLVELHDALLDGVCRVLALTQDRRFNLSRQLDSYIASRPVPPARTAVVLLTALQRSINRVVDDPTDPKAGRRARERIKTGGWLLKLIGGKSNNEWVGVEGQPAFSNIPDAVRHSISSLFSTVRQLLRSPPGSMVLLSQTVLVNQLHSWLSAASYMLTPREIWMLSRSVVEASSGAGGVLAVWRLLLIRQVIRTLTQSHGNSPDSLGSAQRVLDEEMVRTVVNWVGDCWGERGLILSEARTEARTGSIDGTANSPHRHSKGPSAVNGQFEAQVRLCAAIVADLADHLPSAADVLPGLVESYCLLEGEGSFVTVAETNAITLPQDDSQAEFPMAEFDASTFPELDSETSGSEVIEKRWSPVGLFPASYPFPIPATVSSPSPALPELGALFAKLCSRQIPFAHAQVEDDSELQASPDTPNLADTLSRSLYMIGSMVSPRICPSSWLSVRSVFHRAASVALSSVYRLLADSFLPPPDGAESFSTELWKSFLTTAVALGSSNLLALEASPEQQRRAVWQIAGDVRAQVADIIVSSWDSLGWPAPTHYSRVGIRTLGGFQVQYVPSLVGPVAGIAIGVHGKLRRAGIHIIRSMVLSEWGLARDLGVIEAALADGLAVAVARGNERFSPRRVVIADLREAFSILSRDERDLEAAFQHMISLVDELLGLLTTVHTSDEAAVPGALRLLELARLLGRDAMFIRYAHRLARLHSAAGHYAEAGLAIRLHADLYEWDSSPLQPLENPRFPPELASARKERLYRTAIGYFEKAAAWENALDGYSELSAHYEFGSFDFGKLARAQRATAAIHEAIGSGRRASPRFFRAAFRGLGWPTELRNRQYIFEAGPDERAAGVATRLQTQYPTCTVVGSDAKASDGEGQYLVLAPVSVHRDVSSPVFLRPRVGPAVREFISAGRPREFSVSVRRGGTVVAKLVFVTAEAFPTILRRSEIVDVRTEPVSQVGHAVETVTRRTTELAVLFRRAEGKVLVGAGETQHSHTEAVSILLNRLSRLIDSKDELSCVSERELLRLPSEVLVPKSSHSVSEGDSVSMESSNPPASLDLRPALRTVLLDHVLMLRRCVSGLGSLSASVSLDVRREFSDRLHQVWAPELAILESLGISADRPGESRPHRSVAPSEKVDEMSGLTEIMTRLTTGSGTSRPPFEAGHERTSRLYGPKRLNSGDGHSARTSLLGKQRGNGAGDVAKDRGNSHGSHAIPIAPLGNSFRDNQALYPSRASVFGRKSPRTASPAEPAMPSSRKGTAASKQVMAPQADYGHHEPRDGDVSVVPSHDNTQLFSALGSSGFELDLDLHLDGGLVSEKGLGSQFHQDTSFGDSFTRRNMEPRPGAGDFDLPAVAELPADEWRG